MAYRINSPQLSYVTNMDKQSHIKLSVDWNYLFPNWEWMNNFIIHFIMDASTYPCRVKCQPCWHNNQRDLAKSHRTSSLQLKSYATNNVRHILCRRCIKIFYFVSFIQTVKLRLYCVRSVDMTYLSFFISKNMVVSYGSIDLFFHWLTLKIVFYRMVTSPFPT